MTHWPRWNLPPGLAAGKGWWWEKLPSPIGLRSTSVESAGQRHWGGPSKNWHQGTDLMKPEGSNQTRTLHLVIPLLTGLAQVALEIQALMVLLSEKLSGPCSFENISGVIRGISRIYFSIFLIKIFLKIYPRYSE